MFDECLGGFVVACVCCSRSSTGVMAMKFVCFAKELDRIGRSARCLDF